MLAAQTAFALRRLTDKRVLLADFDLAGGGISFEDMRAQLEGQFGAGEELRDVDVYTLVSEVVGVKWIDSQTEMQLRTLRLYGVLAVVLTERATLANL